MEVPHFHDVIMAVLPYKLDLATPKFIEQYFLQLVSYVTDL